MRGRKPERFQLKPMDKVYLRKLLRDGETPWRIARRAQILLQRADQEQRVGALGERLEQNASTIWRICQRYRDGDLQTALYDAPRPGRPRVFFQKSAKED